MEDHKELLQRLVEKIKENNLDIDLNKILEAYILANESHIGQKRRSGEDYILHPIEVAEILVDMKMDTDTIVAGILHDVVEDTLITLPDIEYTFGKDVRKLVDGVTKLRNLPKTDSKKIENIRKMVVAMSEDIRVVIIKLADRLHNMRTLKYMSSDKQQIKSKETLEIYAPIAHRIGMAKIKWELEDISFRYLYSLEYREISDLVNSKREEREEYTAKIIEKIEKELEKNKIKGEVTGRAKHLYSIYRKMIEKEKKFADLNDLIAIRIMVDKEVECYNILGIIHNLFIPVSGRFKDYIAVPKSNGYQSIHTTVKGPNDQNVENPENFAQKVTGSLLNQTIFVFTPKGDVVELQNGSTSLDFAFQVHTQIGYRTIGAKVNEKIVPLDQVLENADKVEILTSKNTKGPGKDWINMVNNSSSKSKIRKWFKDKEFEEKSKEGEQILEREFEKLGIKFKELEEDERVFLYMKKFNVGTLNMLCYKFAVGDLSLDGFMKKFEVKEEKNIEQVLEEETEKGNKRKENSQGGVRISGSENTMYRFAKCCSPLPSDDIRGYVTRGRGIAIHRSDCENFISLMKYEPDREVDVYWDEEGMNSNTAKYQYNFTLKTYDRSGLLLDIIRILNEYKMEIVNVNTNYIKENGNKLCLIHFGIMIRRREDFDRLANNLMSMRDMIDIIKK